MPKKIVLFRLGLAVAPAKIGSEWMSMIRAGVGMTGHDVPRHHAESPWPRATRRHCFQRFTPLIVFCLLTASTARGQDSDYEVLTAEFGQKLSALAERCERDGLGQEAAEVRQLQVLRDPRRQYFFVPSEQGSWTAPGTAERTWDWASEWRSLRLKHAAGLFTLAQKLAAAGEGSRAFTILHEVCVLDPDHEAARKALGYRRRDGRWLDSEPATNVRTPRQRHSLMNWPAGSYVVVVSPHYEISTTAAPDEAVRLAERLERWRRVWRQAFYDYWSRDEHFRAVLDGSDPPQNQRKHEIVFFANREQYVAKLSALGVEGVEQSTGFYSDRHRAALFYAAQPHPVETWLQEQAHQLFQESIDTRKDPVGKSHVWALEGVGMYFESMVDYPCYSTLGGYDHGRLQYARVHWQREAYFVPLPELTSLGRVPFQTRTDVSKLYSQSAGLTHFLMTADQGKYRKGFLQLLGLIYQRRAQPESLSELCQTPDSELETQYKQFLTVDRDEVIQFLSAPQHRTELALGFSNVDSSIAAALAQCPNLRWLQLSSTAVDDSLGSVVGKMNHLTQLFLDRTAITDRCLQDLESLTDLEELDLADTQVTDAGMASIAKLTKLKALWLSGTRVSDRGLADLSALRDLQLLEVHRTAITPDALQRLKQQLPQLK